jgi:hypothetical protein
MTEKMIKSVRNDSNLRTREGTWRSFSPGSFPRLRVDCDGALCLRGWQGGSGFGERGRCAMQGVTCGFCTQFLDRERET